MVDSFVAPLEQGTTRATTCFVSRFFAAATAVFPTGAGPVPSNSFRRLFDMFFRSRPKYDSSTSTGPAKIGAMSANASLVRWSMN